MTTQDHNKTLVSIYFAVGLFFAFGLLISPWIIAQNFRHKEQIPAAVLIFGLVFCIALVMFVTAFAMHRKKTLRKEARVIVVRAAHHNILACWHL